jgi:fimbrial chaperone protein
MKRFALIAFSAFAFGAQCYAADIQLSPVNLTLTPAQKVETLRITNTGSTPVPVQMRGLKWSQVDGQSLEVPTQEIRFQPTMATIQPGQTQVIRVVKVKAPAGQEEAYRVVVSELPTEIQKSESENKAVFLLNYSLPLFYRAAGAAASLRGEYKAGELILTNTGTATAKVYGVKAGSEMVVPGLLGYVLPGSTMRFPIDAAPGLRSFTATVNGVETHLF